MKILYGTGNPAKLAAMRRRMETLNLEIIGLKEIDGEIPSVPEDGNTPLENARQKALAYYRVFHMPVFSCDSGLYFENVPEKDQPGVHVRNINGRCLSDEEMISHYAGLAVKYGNLTAKYKNAICFVMDETHIYEAMEPSMESVSFIITSKPHGSVPQKDFRWTVCQWTEGQESITMICRKRNWIRLRWRTDFYPFSETYLAVRSIRSGRYVRKTTKKSNV